MNGQEMDNEKPRSCTILLQAGESWTQDLILQAGVSWAQDLILQAGVSLAQGLTRLLETFENVFVGNVWTHFEIETNDLVWKTRLYFKLD